MPTLENPLPKTTRRTITGAVTAMAVLTGAAVADDVAFAYRASELESATGAAALYERLEARAAHLCRANTSSGDRKACTDDLISDFVDGIDHQRLTARHSENGA